MEDIKCNRCGSVNDYYTQISGPHIKAICKNCNRYIKFITKSKPQPIGLKLAINIMVTNLSVKLNLSKIDKSKLFKGEKGVYLDAAIIMRDEVDQYGNCGMIIQSVLKEEREKGIKGVILGNVSYIQKQDSKPSKAEINEVLPF